MSEFTKEELKVISDCIYYSLEHQYLKFNEQSLMEKLIVKCNNKLKDLGKNDG